MTVFADQSCIFHACKIWNVCSLNLFLFPDCFLLKECNKGAAKKIQLFPQIFQRTMPARYLLFIV